VLTKGAQHGAFARMMDGINRRQQRLDDLTYRLEKSQRKLIEQQRRRWERASAAVRHYDARRVLAGIRHDLAAQLTAIAHAMRTRLLQQKSRLEQSERQLKALSPVAVLDRGYALVFNAAGKLVRSTTQVQPGDEISAQLSDGRVIAKVEKSED
jgi:exodeoxyribonuclease VII large subunit